MAQIPHIGDLGQDAPVGGLDQAHRFLELFLARRLVLDTFDGRADVDGDDVGPFFGEPHRVGATLATGCTGDEGHLAFDSSCNCRTSFTR